MRCEVIFVQMFFFFLLSKINSLIIGIDLGTTFSVVALYRNGGAEIIPNEADHRTTPSVVSFYNGERTVGETATKMATISPESTIFAVKRLMGRGFNEDAVQKELKRVPFHIVERDGRPYVKIPQEDDDILLSPEEISGLILSRLKHQAEKFLNQSVHDAVITVPAYFNEEQRKATKIAGEIAGLNARRIISEPTAAALAYGLNDKGDKYVIVYDLGGGTFDVSLLAMDDGYYEVQSTGGDTRLGGEDFDEKCVENIIQKFSRSSGRDASRDRVAMARLKKACEKAKISLSNDIETTIEIPLFYDNQDLKETFTREEFNRINMPYFQKTIDTLTQVLKDGNITADEVADVVMIGGSTRIPIVRELVSQYFGGKKLCTEINPDEAVAIGAAIQASVLENKSDIVVVDVYPLTLGVETVGGLMSPIIPRNTRIPVRRSKIYTTHQDDAAGARIEVFEGERKLTRDNRAIGVFELHRLPRAPRNTLQIEVSFQIDANAILTVTAQELTTKTVETIEINTLDLALSAAQIDEAIENANSFQSEDEKDVKRVLARRDFEGVILDTQSMLKAEKGNPLYGKTMYKDLRKKLKEHMKWLEENPMESPETYSKKSELLREEFSFLFGRGQLPDL